MKDQKKKQLRRPKQRRRKRKTRKAKETVTRKRSRRGRKSQEARKGRRKTWIRSSTSCTCMFPFFSLRSSSLLLSSLLLSILIFFRNNTRCRIEECKNNVVISRFCEFCKYRYCIYHGYASTFPSPSSPLPSSSLLFSSLLQITGGTWLWTRSKEESTVRNTLQLSFTC